MPSSPIYLDYAATTPVDKVVVEEMYKYLSQDGIFGNPSSQHAYGISADNAVKNARSVIANFLECKPNDIIFTSGATESNNIAIKGIARAHQSQGKHIVTSYTEHKAVLDTCKTLEEEGFQISYLKPDEDGIISVDNLVAALRNDTVLVSLMHVNNETGTTQNLSELGREIKKHGIYFHVDGAQSIGKIPINLCESSIDLLSCSSHKIYGPMGVGFLYIKNRSKTVISPLMHGGGQEFGLRPGTLPTHQIAGLGKAIELAQNGMEDDMERAIQHRNYIFDTLNNIEGVVFNSSPAGSPYIINVSFNGVEAETLVVSLQNEVAISSGSACTTGSIEPSHVIRGMGIEGERLSGAVRLSYGRFTTQMDLDSAVKKITEQVVRIRSYG